MHVSHERYAFSDEALIARCLQHFPALACHTCRNDKGPTFGCVMNTTSTPHILEHLVIDLETREACDESRVFTGTTQWDQGTFDVHTGKSELCAHMAVSFEDDLVALGALTRALEFLNDTLISLRGEVSR